jgi:hypothetical protein
MTKKFWQRSFPAWVAIFCFVFYQLLYRPRRHSLEMVVSLLLFFTALAWSALIFLSLEQRHWLRYVYALLGAAAAVILVEAVRPCPESMSLLRLTYGLNLLGIALIEFYLSIIRKKQGK